MCLSLHFTNKHKCFKRWNIRRHLVLRARPSQGNNWRWAIIWARAHNEKWGRKVWWLSIGNRVPCHNLGRANQIAVVRGLVKWFTDNTADTNEALMSSQMLLLGYSQVKPDQMWLVEVFLEGNDVFVCLPTGTGKYFAMQQLSYNSLHPKALRWWHT